MTSNINHICTLYLLQWLIWHHQTLHILFIVFKCMSTHFSYRGKKSSKGSQMSQYTAFFQQVRCLWKSLVKFADCCIKKGVSVKHTAAFNFYVHRKMKWHAVLYHHRIYNIGFLFSTILYTLRILLMWTWRNIQYSNHTIYSLRIYSHTINSHTKCSLKHIPL